MSNITEVLDNVQKALDTYKEKGKATTASVGSALEVLQTATLDLAKLVQELTKGNNALEVRTREHEDELDDYKQKNLKGKFIITSTKEKATPVKKSEELAADGGEKALPAHIIFLAMKKYAVTLKEEDIASCHYLPGGGIFFSLWNMGPESAYVNLTKNIKSSINRDINIYFNFMLTKRRSALLFEVRKMKRNTKIIRYYSDEEGSIAIKVKDKDTNIKLTSFYKTKTSPVRTYRIPELFKKVADMQPQ